MCSLTELFTNIANAIREKKGTTDSIVAETFPTEIRNLQIGGGDVKLFATVKEMQDDNNPAEGDLAVIYGASIEKELIVGNTYESMYFPQTIVFDTARTGTTYIHLNSTSTSLMNLTQAIKITASKICFVKKGSTFSPTELTAIVYTSTDGITYTRTDSLNATVTIAEIYANAYTTITVQETNADLLQQMFKVHTIYFGGLFKYDGTAWVVAPSQLDTDSEYVYEKEFYGANGLVIGTLQNTTNLTAKQLTLKTQIWNALRTLEILDTSLNKLFASDDTLITTPTISLPNATNTSYMFNNCPALVEVKLMNTGNVMNMQNMFHACRSLVSVSGLDTSSVTNMNSMFRSCNSLAEIPTLNTSNVSDMAHLFNSCFEITTVPQLDTTNVTNMSYMFNGCSSLISIPSLDTSKVTSFNSMFSGCTSLSNASLNNILKMCANATSYTGTKTLKHIGLTSAQATTCTGLSNWSAASAAGWTTGY